MSVSDKIDGGWNGIAFRKGVRDMKISDLMNKDLVALRTTDTISAAIDHILKHCRTGLAVVDEENRVVGFVSEEDIIRKVLPGYVTMLKSSAFLPDCGQFAQRFAAKKNTSVTEIMQREVFCANEKDSDFNIATEMIRRHFKLCPVVDDDRKFLGYISRAYLIRGMILSDARAERKKINYE